MERIPVYFGSHTHSSWQHKPRPEHGNVPELYKLNWKLNCFFNLCFNRLEKKNTRCITRTIKNRITLFFLIWNNELNQKHSFKIEKNNSKQYFSEGITSKRRLTRVGVEIVRTTASRRWWTSTLCTSDGISFWKNKIFKKLIFFWKIVIPKPTQRPSLHTSRVHGFWSNSQSLSLVL